MGTWTYDNFKTYLKFRMGNNDKFDDYYGIWVNSAYRYLCSLDTIPNTKIKLVFPDLDTTETKTTTAGATYVAKPTNALIINDVYDSTNDTWLDWIPYNAYSGKTDTDTVSSRGKPSFWTRRGSYVFLYPTPDAAYSILIGYRMLPAAMSSDADLSTLSTEWDTIILELAVWTARDWVGEIDKSEYARKLGNEMIAGLAAIYNNEEKSRRERVRPDPSLGLRRSFE